MAVVEISASENPIGNSPMNLAMTVINHWIRSRWFVTVATGVFAIYFFWLITDGSLSPDFRSTRWPIDPKFFWLQADAMLQGRLNVNPNLFRGECWYSDGECFGYFGITPSVIRLSFVALFGTDNNGFTPVFLSAGIGVAYWFSMDLVRRVLLERQPFSGASARAREAIWLVFSAILLGPASVLVFLAQPYFYQESIGWMVAGLCLFTNMMWRWSRDRKSSQMTMAIVGLVAATGCRPTALPVGFIAGLGILLFLFWNRQLGRSIVTQLAIMMFLPIVTAVAIYLNKFGTILPDVKTYVNYNGAFAKYRALNNEQLTGSRYVLTNLFSYLRPDSLTVSATDPWFGFRFTSDSTITYLPPLKQGSVFTESTASLTATMPIAVVLTPLTAIVLVTRNAFRSLATSMELVLLAALCAPPLVLLMTASQASRYLCDFYPLVVLGVALSPALLARFVSVDRLLWRAATVAAFGVTLVSAIVLRQLLVQV
jgi:hypothetical protein